MSADTKVQAEEFKQKGNKALQAKEFKEAVEMYTKAIELDPSNHVYFSNRSAAYLSMNDGEKALDDADKCVSLKNDWPKGYNRKGTALHFLKRYEESAAVFEEGLSKFPDDEALKKALQNVKEDMTRSRGNSPFAAAFGDDMFARIASNRKLAPYLSDPSYIQSLNMLKANPQNISMLMSDKRMMETFSFLIGIDLGAMNPGDRDDGAEGEGGTSKSTESKTETKDKTADDHDDEKDDEDEVEEMDAEDAEEMARKKEEKRMKKEAMQLKDEGNNFYKKKEFEKAIELYDKAHELDESNITVLNNKAACYIEMGKYEESIKICEEAVELGRKHRADYVDISKSFLRISKAYQKMDRLEDAINALERAQMENYTKETERNIKSLNQLKKKKEEEAYIDPEKGAEAKEAGNEAFRAGNFPDAIKSYREAIRRDPSNAAYYNNCAAALAKLGDFVEAKEMCEKALKLDPKYVKAWAKKGDIESFMKEYHRAMESYKNGLKVDENNQLCLAGLQRVTAQIQSSTGEFDEERLQHAMADPEIQAIFRDPVIQQVLQDFQSSPSEAQKAMRDPVVREKIEKLIAAGVIRAS